MSRIESRRQGGRQAAAHDGAGGNRRGVSRATFLLGTSIMAYALLPSAAWAQNECGAPPPGGGTVTCEPAGNPYPNGINYDPVVADLTVVLEPGVVVQDSVQIGSSDPGVDLSLQGPTDTQIVSDQAGFSNGEGARVVSTYGTVAITLDDVSTLLDDARGIVGAGEGTVTVSADTVATVGDYSIGIVAEETSLGAGPVAGTPGGTSVTVNSVTTSGQNAFGISAFSENGDTVVDVGTVTTTGDFATGVFIGGVTGEVRVTSDTIDTSGVNAFGIRAEILLFPDEVPGPTVLVDSGSITTTGDGAVGIRALAPLTDVTVLSDTISTSGDNAHGILAFIPGQFVGPGDYSYGEGDVLVDSTTIATQGVNSDGIIAAGADAVTVISASVATEGDRSAGIYAETYFDGNIVITSGSVTTAGDTDNSPPYGNNGSAHGIEARANGGSITIDSTSVETGGTRAVGILATSSTGAITITSNSVSTEGNGSGGILAESESGDIVIDSGSVTTAGDTILGQPGVIAAGARGIEALSDGGSITIDSTTITTGGSNADGILAESESGAIDITSGTITTADGRGIDATSVSGDINIESGAVTTIGGLFSDGIIVETDSGDIVIDSGTVSVGDGVGLFAITQSGDITITSDEVTVTGDLSPGIAAYGDYYVGGDINVVSGSVETTGSFANGIDVESRGVVSVQSTSIVTEGDGSTGITATSYVGGVTIESGTIATSGPNARGIRANVYNDADIVIDSGTVTTLGDNGDGIAIATLADSSTGTFTIASTSVSTEGHRSHGIYAYHAGSGDIVVTSGAVTTAGNTEDVPYGGSHAIALHANEGSITVASTTVGTEGIGAFGILATSNSGAINITSGTVTTSGAGAIGISATTGPGSTTPEVPPEEDARLAGDVVIAAAPVATPPDISITSTSVSTTGDYAVGISATTEDGDIFIESGTVATSGEEATGILAETKYGSITIDSGSVATSGANASGIVAAITGGEDIKYGDGTILVTSDSVTVTGGGDTGALTSGINATGPQDVTIVSGSVVTSGGGVDGISVSSQYGLVSVTSDTISTQGDFAQGILALGVEGSVIVTNTDTIETNGVDSPGITAFAFYSGNVTVDSASVVTHDNESPGINAQTAYGDVTVTSDSVVTGGNYSDGIFAIASTNVLDDEAEETLDGTVTITSGTINASGDGSAGIRAYGASVTITSTSVTTTGASIETDFGTVDSVGIHARAFGTRPPADEPGPTVPGFVEVTSGSVSTAGDDSHGIHAEADIGDVEVTTTGTTSTAGANSIGIYAHIGAYGDGTGDVTVTSATVTTGGAASDGIRASTGDGDVAVTSGSVTTDGNYSSGIDATSYGGAITIDSGSVDVSGNGSRGISAIIATGLGVISISSDSMIVGGPDADGIYARGLGEIVVNSGAIDHAGSANAIDVATASPGGDVTVTSGAITKSGAQDAIVAVTTDGDVSVTSTSIASTFDSDTSQAGGINASSLQGSVTVDSGTVATAGDNSAGIFGQTDSGSVAITSGNVVTSGDISAGIVGRTSDGDVAITSGSVTTSGTDSPGISATAPGTITIVSGSVTTSGAGSEGIHAHQLVLDGGGGGDALAAAAPGSDVLAALGPDGGVTITSGSVTTSGAGSAGIDALAEAGDVEIVSTGTVTTTGADSDGIVATSETGAASVDAGGVSVSGAGSDAIVITAVTDSDVIIRGLVTSPQGFAVQADGAPVAVNTTASGTIRGRVDLTDGADTIDNAGTFDAIGTSQFVGGDVFNNSGTTRSVNGAAALLGLDAFNNSGTIDMSDGAANDRLTVGNFTGLAGSRLAVDVDFAAGISDVLVTGAATGSTLVDVNGSGSSLGLTTGILVIDGAAGTSPTAFSLEGGNIDNGYVTSGLIFRPADFDFLLVNTASNAVFETAVVGGMTLDVWHQSADAVEYQLETARAPAAAGTASNLTSGRRFAGWIQVYAGEIEREAVQPFTTGGTTTLFDVSYEQDFEGVQSGFDYQSGPVVFGLTFGVGSSDSTFEASASRLELESTNLGAYAAFASGGFYFNLLAKVDWIDLETDPGPGLAAEFDATAYGVRGVAGFRFDLGDFFAEPSVSLSWVETSIEDYQSGGATVSFDNATSLRGTAGLRVGGAFATGGGGVLSPFLGIRVIEEFSDDAENTFLLGTTINLAQETPGTHGEASAGLTFTSDNVEAFLRGELDFGGEVDGQTVRAGVRLRF